MIASTVNLVAAMTLAVGMTVAAQDAEPGAASADAAATHVVAQDGSGDHATIGEAVAAAADGDTVLVRPGTYEETLVIDKDIMVSGDGPREEVVIAPSDSGTPMLTIRDAEALVSQLTLRGPDTHLVLIGGAPLLRDLVFDGVASPPATDVCHALFAPEGCNPLTVDLDGTQATITHNVFRDSGQLKVHGGSTATIEGNDMSGGAHVFLEDFAEGTTVRDNAFVDPGPAAIAIFTSGAPVIEGNDITGATTSGIKVGLLQAPGIAPLIRDNRIADSAVGIEVTQGADPTIEDNQISGNNSGIVITGSDAVVAYNALVDNANGVFVMAGSPAITGNTISGGTVGIGLGSDRAEPLLSGNLICENESNFNLIFGAELPALDSNEICPEAAAEEGD